MSVEGFWFCIRRAPSGCGRDLIAFDAAGHDQVGFGEMAHDGAGVVLIGDGGDALDIEAGLAPHLPGIAEFVADEMADAALVALLLAAAPVRA